MLTLPVETRAGRILLGLLAVALGALGLAGVRVAAPVAGGLGVIVGLAVTAAAHRRARAVLPSWPVGPLRGVLWSLAPLTSLIFLAWWPARLARELRRDGAPPPVAWSLLLLGASALGFLGLGALTTLAWLAFGWFVQSRLGEREPAPGAPAEEARVVPWLDTLWLSCAAAVVVSPPDVISMLLLLLVAAPLAAVTSWFALGRLRSAGGPTRRAVAGATAVVIPVLLHAVQRALTGS